MLYLSLITPVKNYKYLVLKKNCKNNTIYNMFVHYFNPAIKKST